MGYISIAHHWTDISLMPSLMMDDVKNGNQIKTSTDEAERDFTRTEIEDFISFRYDFWTKNLKSLVTGGISQ